MSGKPLVCRVYSLALTLIAFALSGYAPASEVKLLRDRKPADRPSVLLVGVAHFNNPAHDAINVKIDDVLAPKRQQEIEVIVERLAAYKPTHVAVEWPIAEQARLDERYQAYREGRYTLTRNEVDHLGLRLAAKLKLSRVDAVDWNEDSPGKDEDYDYFAWAKAHGRQNILDTLFDPHIAKDEEARLARSTLSDYVCWLNAPERLRADNRIYFDIAMIGDAKNNPGAAWTGSWYGRNLRIFGNIVSTASQSNDRVVVIYGAGHAFLLEQFSQQSGALRVENVQSYLDCR